MKCLLGDKPELLGSIIATAVAVLALLISKVLQKEMKLSEKIFHAETVNPITKQSGGKTTADIPQAEGTGKAEDVQSMTGNNAVSSTKKENTENKGSLLSQLQDKYSTFDITEGTFSKNQISSQSKGFQGVMIRLALHIWQKQKTMKKLQKN